MDEIPSTARAREPAREPESQSKSTQHPAPSNKMSFVKRATTEVLIWIVDDYLPSLIFDIDEDDHHSFFTEEVIEIFATELCEAKEELIQRELDMYPWFEEQGKFSTRERKRAEKRVGKRAERSKR